MLMAQNKTVKGRVISSEDGEPIYGATVVITGTTTGAVTDIDGNFSLKVSDADKKLTVSFVGMTSEEVSITSAKTIKVILSPKKEVLDEVMVVAYGTQKKSSFTGSAAVVNSGEIGKVQVTNPVDALRGKAAGVQIYNSTGQPGSVPGIRIRGTNSINAGSDPLIVLDGSPYDGSLNDINPVDIESMTVLKDAASTSLYGARGGNGVILITTKRASRGQASKVTIDAKWGVNTKATPNYNVISSPARYYEMWYQSLYNYAINKRGDNPAAAWAWANSKLTSSDKEGLGYNVYTIPEGQAMIGQNGKLNPNATLGRVVTHNGKEYMLMPDDWEDATYGNALRQEYTVSASGSTDRSNFYVSANYLDNEGITAASDYKRFTGRLKADFQLKEWLKVSANGAYGHWNRNMLGSDGESANSGNIFSMVNLAPIYPIYIRDGQGNFIYDQNSRQYLYDYGDRSINGQYRPYLGQSNPLSANLLDVNNTEGNSLNATGEIEVRLPLGFTFTSINSVYMREARSTQTTNPFFGQYATSNGEVMKEHERVWSYNYQQRLNWKHLFGKHDLDLMAAHEYYRTRSYDLWGQRSNQFSVFNTELAGAVISQNTNSSTGDYNDERWIARAQYNYNERYFAQASVTHEASSYFDPDHRWGTFWSFGGAWLLSKEDWFDTNLVDELKLKASYGENGNDQIGSYRYITYFNIKNSNDNVSLTPAALGNEDISWEKNAKFNVGFDFSMFKGRLTGGLEFYANKTHDMLSWFPLPASFGYTGYYANIGNMVNRGLEFEFRGDIIRNKELTWSAYVNMTTNHNEITKLPDARKTWYDEIQEYGYSSGSFFYAEGHSRYTYYTRRYAGVDAATGEALYYKNIYETDDNGNVMYYDTKGKLISDPDSYQGTKRRKIIGEEKTAKYSEADDYLCGDVQPDVYGGFGTSASWKGIDLSIDFQYQLGGYVYDGAYAGLMSGNTAGYAMHADLEKAWSPTNTSSNIPRMQYGDQYTTSASDRFLTSASYLSLQNIMVGYTLPKAWTGKIAVDKIRFYCVADNVWVWSKRQGLDPRQSITGGASNQYYAPIRTISGGVSVTF